MKLVDANVVLRYLVQDNMEHALASKALFERTMHEGDVLAVSEAIVAELVYVLTSSRLYGIRRAEAAGKIAAVLGTSLFQFTDKSACLRALEVFAERSFLDFPDALLVAHAESEPGSIIYSFDRDFDRYEGVTRIEPAAS